MSKLNQMSIGITVDKTNANKSNVLYIRCHNDKDIELALKLSAYVHDTCENVPHDIGLKLLKIIKEFEK